MFLGFTMMLGIIGLLDVPLNPANMIVLPLVLGIGIDYGIHLIHDFRNRRVKRYTVSASTATSILITSLTTIVGFGSMMIASHRGLQSLGRVLVIGITCCLITSVIVLPAILTLWTRGEKDEPIQRSSPPKRKRLVRR
jgi:predicted RND superfamily exporter protein